MPLSYIILFCLVTSLLVYVFFYYVSAIQRNNNWADYAWAVGFPIIAFVSYLLGGRHDLSKQFLITTLIFIWSGRLLVHLVTRNRDNGEIFRYHRLRNKWRDKTVLFSFFRIYLLNWFLLSLVAFPIIIINTTGGYFIGKIELFGIMLWAFGFVYETVADYELYHYKLKASHRDKIYDQGLWKYSRHPNYLGEIVMWVGLYFVALPHPYGVYTVISPAVIAFMLLGFSGIPAIEKRYRGNEDYKKYKKKTSILIPLPSKS